MYTFLLPHFVAARYHGLHFVKRRGKKHPDDAISARRVKNPQVDEINPRPSTALLVGQGYF